MAVITTLAASPHLYRASVVKEGAGTEVFTIPNATIVGALPPGPLRRLFQATYASDAAAQAALRDSPDCDLRVVAQNTNTSDPISVNVVVDGSNLAQLQGSQSGVAGTAQVVVTSEFRHSIIR